MIVNKEPARCSACGAELKKGTMTSKEKAKLVLSLWRQFVEENGGKDNLHANIIWKWSDYLRERLLQDFHKVTP